SARSKERYRFPFAARTAESGRHFMDRTEQASCWNSRNEQSRNDWTRGESRLYSDSQLGRRPGQRASDRRKHGLNLLRFRVIGERLERSRMLNEGWPQAT